jgi:hypothetical protein
VGLDRRAALLLLKVIRVVNHRRERTLSEERGGRQTDDDESDDPAKDGLADDEPVDTLTTFEHGDANSGADLAVGGGKRPAETGTHDDNTGSAEFNADTTTRRELGNLGAESVKNLVAIKGETGNNARGAEAENPVRVATHFSLTGNLARPEDDNHGSERANGVGHIVGTVRERVAARRENLEITHREFSLFVKLLGVFVNSLHRHVLFQDVVSLVCERVLEMVAESVPDAKRRAHDASRVLARLTNDLLFNLLNARAEFSLFELHLFIKFFRSLQDVWSNSEVRNDADATADTEGDGEGRAERRVVELEELRTLVHDEENVDDKSTRKKHGERDGRAREGVLGSHHQGSQGDKEDEGKTTRHNRRQEPRDDNRDDPADERESVGFLRPDYAAATAGNHGHTDHAADARVRRRHRHFKEGGEDEPNGDSENDAKAAVHEKTRIILETILIGNTFADGLHDVTTHEHGATKFKDAGEDDGVLNAECTRADRRGESVRDVVGADSEGGEERQETAANAHPFELLGFGGTSEKLARSLSERFSGAHGTTR